MPSAKLRHKYESFESLFRRFVRAVEKDETMIYYKKHQEFISNGEKNKQKRMQAIKREHRRRLGLSDDEK